MGIPKLKMIFKSSLISDVYGAPCMFYSIFTELSFICILAWEPSFARHINFFLKSWKCYVDIIYRLAPLPFHFYQALEDILPGVPPNRNPNNQIKIKIKSSYQIKIKGSDKSTRIQICKTYIFSTWSQVYPSVIQIVNYSKNLEKVLIFWSPEKKMKLEIKFCVLDFWDFILKLLEKYVLEKSHKMIELYFILWSFFLQDFFSAKDYSLGRGWL